MLKLVFTAHLLTCLLLTGLIWTVQLVHYPAFRFIDKERFTEYAKFHQFRISLFVVPLMLIELTSGALLAFSNFTLENGINITILAVIWAVTVFISMPCHKKLQEGHNEWVIDRLVLTNWIRTVGWTLRSAALIAVILT